MDYDYEDWEEDMLQSEMNRKPRPFKCSDGLCGQEDCARCHPENFVYDEEGRYRYEQDE